MSDGPIEILERWIRYVNTLEVEKSVNLYNDNSTLLPTFSPNSISEPEQIKLYFQKLSTRKNLRVELHKEALRKTDLGENKYVLTGIYSFHFLVDDASQAFPSRFTFILDVSNEKPIIHHHSSQIPRTPS